MNFRSPDKNYVSLTLLMVVMILYGSLYPFAFHAVRGGIGPLHTLFGSWNRVPGRGDFISNIILYMPLGFCGGLKRAGAPDFVHIGRIVLIGAGLSFAIEYLQYYDLGRDTEATDFYANLLGTILGAGVARFFGRKFRVPLLREIVANPLPALLIVCWTGYRLYPYVPTIDAHKYWRAIKPIFLEPDFSLYTFFRQTVVWLVLCLLIEKITGRARLPRMFLLFALFIMGASVLILSGWLNVPRVVAPGLAFFLWRFLGDEALRDKVPGGQPAQEGRRLYAVIALFGIYIVTQRLAPFHFSGHAGHFGWVPFLSFMRGSIDLDVQSFFEKFFLYGSFIWLLVEAGLPLRLATIFLTLSLFATSRMEMFLPGRSAEITDAIMALAIGGIIELIGTRRTQKLRPTDTLTGRLTLFTYPDIAFELTPDSMGEMRPARRVDGF